MSAEVIELVKTEFRGLRNAGTEIIYTPGTGELGSGMTAPPFMLDFNASCIFQA